jgi:hypothetical protein
MTKQEHELMVLMFARWSQAMMVISDALKRDNIWTDEDEKAFRAVAQYDDKKIIECAALALTEYLKCAKQVGVRTGLDEPPVKPALPG